MLRTLIHFLPALLPAAVYFAWVFLRRRQAVATGVVPPWWRDAPVIWLSAAGVALLALSLGLWAVLGGAPAGIQYVPPRYEEGVMVPGRFAEPTER
ncbi:MAG: DUF6111 family protein [Alphaproteobacteria bacterium]